MIVVEIHGAIASETKLALAFIAYSAYFESYSASYLALFMAYSTSFMAYYASFIAYLVFRNSSVRMIEFLALFAKQYNSILQLDSIFTNFQKSTASIHS